MWSLVAGLLKSAIGSIFGLITKDTVEEAKSKAATLEAQMKDERDAAELENKIKEDQDAIKDPKGSDEDLTGANDWNVGR